MISHIKIKSIVVGSLLAVLPGCGGNAQDQSDTQNASEQAGGASASAIRAATVDPSTYAGRIQVK